MIRRRVAVWGAFVIGLLFLTITASSDWGLPATDHRLEEGTGRQPDGRFGHTSPASALLDLTGSRDGFLSKEARELRQKWSESAEWKRADGLFDTASPEPLVLIDNADRSRGLLYLENQHIYRLFSDERGAFRQQQLLKFDQGTSAGLWRNGDHVLIGEQLRTRDHPMGKWHSIEQHADPARPFAVIPLDPMLGPEQLLTATFTENPRLIFLTFMNGSGFSEYVYKPGESRFLSVNLRFANPSDPDTWDRYRLRKPSPQAEPLAFERQRQFPLPQGSLVSVFEDERGTIVFWEAEYPVIARFVDHAVTGFRPFEDIHGNRYLLGRFQAPDGKADLAFLNGSSLLFFDDNPRLFQDEWNMYNLYNYYKIGGPQIELFHYEIDWSTRKAAEIYESYPLSGARFTGRSGDWLHFERSGESLVLSAYDLIHYRPADRTAVNRLEDLWIHQPDLTWTITSTTNGGEQHKLSPLKVPQSLWQGVDSYASFPQPVREALEKSCIVGCGDYSTLPVVRHIGSEWIVLVEETLYRVENGELAELAKLPVTLSYTAYYGKGGSSRTASDFTEKDGYWYVADTFGNRILKLDDRFAVVKEQPLPYPASIDAGIPDTLQVVGISGVTRMNADLHIIGETAALPETWEPMEEIDWFQESYLADPETGRTWIHFLAHVIIYEPGSERYRAYYTGFNLNGSFRTKLIPYGDEIIVLMDEKALIFSRGGMWKRTLTFPRVQPDGEYIYHLSGEGSYQLDMVNKKLYLVQGYRIIGIDLVSGQHAERFRQNIATAGNLVLHDNKLIFTLHRGDLYDDRQKRTNQLVVLDLASGHVTRYGLDAGLVTSRITENGDLEFIAPLPGVDPASEASMTRSFPLDLLK
ncbi:hypothetical protein [Paenibacillus sp. GCM10012303]|uniref:hypothetical protein n=1 Tax=Paenibacillus sp. GCM10012303 TaxID=3317340 RepID=UPI00360ECD73